MLRTDQTDNDITDRELISQHVERVMVHADRIAVTLRCTETGANQSDAEAGTSFSTNWVIPFIPRLLPRKGIAHAPVEHGTIDPRTQDTLLQAIARSRSWMDAVLAGRTASFDEIASTEGLAERHVRRLVPLAFLSPTIIQAIADGSAPTGLTGDRWSKGPAQTRRLRLDPGGAFIGCRRRCGSPATS